MGTTLPAKPRVGPPLDPEFSDSVRRTSSAHFLVLVVLACAAFLIALFVDQSASAKQLSQLQTRPAPPRLIPVPRSLETIPSVSFTLARDTQILVSSKSSEAVAVATYLARILRRSTGFELPLSEPPAVSGNDISLELSSTPRLGRESYRLDVTAGGVKLQARTPEGLFRGVQTLRQLLPAQIESSKVRSGPWTAPGVHVVDYPRFSWRGAHLDVARHFFDVGVVERYIDLLSAYKINLLHLHLSDDQGWRIVIDSWPKLARIGGKTAVGGSPGGYYTQRDYSDIVRYAAARYITVVPEIDSPGHVNAALASYPELNCNGIAPPPYRGTKVGFSALCFSKQITYTFLDDVIGEIAALTPGPYFHIGGDEANTTKPADYVAFIKRAEQIVQAHGKKMIGWAPNVSDARLSPGSVAQYYEPAGGSRLGTAAARAAVRQGVKLVMSPGNKTYLDMKYSPRTRLGKIWAGYDDVRNSYQWDPASYVNGVREKDVLGVEACLWSETLRTIKDIEYMTFPRLPGVAEIGWSAARGRSWNSYRLRLAAQAPRWRVMSLSFYRSAQVPWQ